MIKAYMKDSVIIHRNTFDQWGEPTEINETIKVKKFNETKWVPSGTGENVQSTARLLMKVDEDVSHDDRITVNNKKYAILQIREKVDFSRVFYEVLI